MNSSKVIDISKSSLVGLKAELLKKQEEVKKLKELHNDNIKPVQQEKKSKRSQKLNKGVEERSLKDVEQTEDDIDMLRKSRELLEKKARLYDKLKLNEGNTARTQYLIDFDLKQEIYSSEKNCNEEKDNNCQPSEDEDAYSDCNSDPENDWVDFVDTLGRSRRCLKKDLPEMKMRDDTLAASLRPPSPPPVAEVTPELLSWDMQREMMRKKWEEQETLLLGKKDIHYQDVLFDEARPHGVGYFGFSTDESERLRQQQELNRIRKETLEQQEAAVGLRLRRQQQLDARLLAARRRKRERMGLPPEDPQPSEPEVSSSKPEEEEQNTEKIEDLEESIKKIAPIRPWDIGKQDAVMSQEEWVEKKRSERPEEFAPPSSILEPPESTKQSLKNKNKHEFKNVYLNKTESDSIGSSFKVTKAAVLANSTDYRPQFSNCNNVIRSKEEGFSEYCPATKHRKPTCEEIEEFLTKTKEKCCQQNESKDHVTSGTKEYSDSTAKSLKLSKEGHNDTAFKRIDTRSTPTISSIHTKINEEVMISESDWQTTQKHEQDIQTGNDCFERSVSNKRKRGVEIPPPLSMSYYGSGATSNKQHSSTKTDLLESISVGLEFLKAKEKKKSRVKGLLDIV